mgnify:CR=1 FL=1
MRNMKVAAGQFTVTEKPEHNISIISGFTSESGTQSCTDIVAAGRSDRPK